MKDSNIRSLSVFSTNVKDSNIRSLSIFSTNVLSYQTFVTVVSVVKVYFEDTKIEKRDLKYFNLYCDTMYICS